MALVQTIRGPVDTSALGLTLIHEHLLFQFDGSRRQKSIDFASKLLQDVADAGVRTAGLQPGPC